MADSVGLGAQAPSLQEALQPISSLLNIQQQKEQVKQSQFKTQADYAQKANEIMGGLLQDKRISSGNVQDATAALTEAVTLAEKYGIPKDQAISFAAPLYSVAQHAPQNLQQIIANSLQGGLSAQGGVSQNLIPAGQQNTVQGTDIYGNPTIVQKNQFGQVQQAQLPVAGQANTQPVMRYRPGESAETVKQLQGEVFGARDAVLPARNGLVGIEEIRKVLPLAETGDYAGLRKTIESLGGSIAGDTKSEIAASAYDIINKNIADLGLQKNAALGNKFASELNAVQSSLPTAEKNPTAIKSALQKLEPLLQHAVNYQQGLTNTLAKHNNDIQYKRDYDNEMAKAFDPKAMMIYNAYKSGNQKEMANLLSGMSAQAKKDVFLKMQKYNSLINGDL